MLNLDFKRVSHASFLLLAFFIARCILALCVRSSLAMFFGAGIESDAYFAAFTIPQQIGDCLIGGILALILIPVFQKRRFDVGDETASQEISGLLNILTAIMIIITLVYLYFIPEIIPAIFSVPIKQPIP